MDENKQKDDKQEYVALLKSIQVVEAIVKSQSDNIREFQQGEEKRNKKIRKLQRYRAERNQKIQELLKCQETQREKIQELVRLKKKQHKQISRQSKQIQILLKRLQKINRIIRKDETMRDQIIKYSSPVINNDDILIIDDDFTDDTE